MKYHYVTNAIQLQLYPYQLYIIKVVTTTYWQMTWWLMKIGLDKGLLRLESNMHILLRFFFT